MRFSDLTILLVKGGYSRSRRYNVYVTILYGPDDKPISGPDLSSSELIKGRGDKSRRKKARIAKINWLGRSIVVVTFLGFGIALLTLFPRLSVSNESPIDPTQPFSTPFRIVNDGYVPLFSVQFSTAISKITPKSRNVPELRGSPGYASRIHNPGMGAKIFWPTDVFTYYSGTTIQSDPLESADIAIVVDYHPFGIPINRERLYRFITLMGPDNQLHWMQRPESE